MMRGERREASTTYEYWLDDDNDDETLDETTGNLSIQPQRLLHRLAPAMNNDTRQMKRKVLRQMGPRWLVLLALVLLQQARLSCGFSATTIVSSRWQSRNTNFPSQDANRKPCCLHAYEAEIAGFTLAFASSHIGMSAIRRELIDRIGTTAESNGLVATGLKLPDIWPGDEAGQEIFPSAEIAGRQLYRILYTIVSFTTLGSGLVAYLNSLAEDTLVQPSHDDVLLYYAVASLSWGISIASLINPSPLSLVPVFEKAMDSKSNNIAPAIRRNDSRKLNAYGLTRITRHPLILPLVPWGFSTAMIMGGQTRDFLFFGILSVYAIAGCAAQDLRVIREEGSVGTVVNPQESMQEFFRETSFIPFQALIESRQSMDSVLREVPWWALIVGTAVGYQMQQALVSFLIG
jgi:uncharacterized membrane protein